MLDKVLGSYRIIDKLGEGGMGEVWRARDERLNRQVAIKILPTDVANDAGRRARFTQEARAVAALNHPNIVAIYDVGEQDGQAYLVSELVEGESLRNLLDRGPIPARKSLNIAVQIADGIAAAHSLGIVHRDLKPENIMITRSGQAKLLDFGLAKQTTTESGDGTATMALSQPGTVMGTAGYMSPEQVRAEAIDARSDIFSFGCVLYEMLTGQRAFRAPTGVETMHAILHSEPQELESDAKIPPAFAPIVRRCLEKQPAQRFQSASDLAFALRNAGNMTATGIQPAVIEKPKPSRPKWLVPLMGAVMFVIAMVAAFFSWRGSGMAEQGHYQRLTFRRGYIHRARFASDGKTVIYTASFDNGRPRTYLAIPGNPDARDLDLPDGVALEAVSANQQLAMIHDGNLLVTSLSGGQARPLLDGVKAADWAPDGESMAVLRWTGGKVRLEYPIGTVVDEQVQYALPMIRVSPDGSRVALAAYGTGSSIRIIVIGRDGKVVTSTIVSGQNTTGEDAVLCWSPKGDEVWFRSFDTAQAGTVYAVDLKGNRRVALALPTRVKLYDITKTGEVLFSSGTGAVGILGAKPDDKAERDLSCQDSGQMQGISGDGNLVVANITGESGGSTGAIYIRKMDGSPPVRIAEGHAYFLSPDAKWVSGFVPTQAADSLFHKRFMLFPTGPGEAMETQAPGLKFTAVMGWLRGDRRYLVEGNLPGKKRQCFDWDQPRGTVRAICAERDRDPEAMASADGTTVLEGTEGGELLLHDVDGGATRKVQGLVDTDRVVGWRDNHTVYVRPGRDNQESMSVSLLDLLTGTKTPWKEIRPAQPVLEVHDLYVAPGGAYAYSYVVADSDLYLARGLTSGVK